MQGTVNLNGSKAFKDGYYAGHSPSQSAPTILVYQVDLIFFRVWNFKKIRSKIGCKKAGSLLFKKRKGSLASSLFE